MAPASIQDLIRAVARPPESGTSDFDLAPDIRAMLPPGRVLRAAAVLMPVVARNGRLAMVLTRRAIHLKHHPGQIAFPGGKVEPSDAGPIAAAVREAGEEIGLPPSAVTVLGTLSSHETVTGFSVTPVLAEIDPGFAPQPDPTEVDEAFEVPLDVLLDPAALSIQRRRWRGQDRAYFAVPYGPYYIWGATARMIKALSDAVREAGPAVAGSDRTRLSA